MSAMRLLTALLLISSVTEVAFSQDDQPRPWSLEQSDPKNSWRCVLTYTSTNCKEVISDWSMDHNADEDTIYNGMQCFGCADRIVIDSSGTPRIVGRNCVKTVGRALTTTTLEEPIYLSRDVTANKDGWLVETWTFTQCFQTWDCAPECDLELITPACFPKTTWGWGFHSAAGTQPCRELTDDQVSPSNNQDIYSDESQETGSSEGSDSSSPAPSNADDYET
jgi:hypothetical protein